MADWRLNSGEHHPSSGGAFYWKEEWSLSRVIWQESLLLEFWDTSEIFCLHLSSLVEQRTADLIANIQTEIGPHRYEKSTWHQKLSVFPHCFSDSNLNFTGTFIFEFTFLTKKKKQNSFHAYPCNFSPIRCILQIQLWFFCCLSDADI